MRSLFTIMEESNPAIAKRNLTRCLLANDNTFLLVAFEQTLKKHFDLVDTAEDGQKAVDHVKAHPPNYYTVIVLDIQMPYMNGIEACGKIKEYLDLPAITSGDLNKSKVSSNGNAVVNIGPSRQPSFISTHRAKPFIYALTSEVGEEMIQQIRNAKFKEIYHFLNQIALKEMLENAGYEYRAPVSDSGSEALNFDPENQYKSSDSGLPSSLGSNNFIALNK